MASDREAASAKDAWAALLIQPGESLLLDATMPKLPAMCLLFSLLQGIACEQPRKWQWLSNSMVLLSTSPRAFPYRPG